MCTEHYVNMCILCAQAVFPHVQSHLYTTPDGIYITKFGLTSQMLKLDGKCVWRLANIISIVHIVIVCVTGRNLDKNTIRLTITKFRWKWYTKNAYPALWPLKHLQLLCSSTLEEQFTRSTGSSKVWAHTVTIKPFVLQTTNHEKCRGHFPHCTPSSGTCMAVIFVTRSAKINHVHAQKSPRFFKFVLP